MPSWRAARVLALCALAGAVGCAARRPEAVLLASRPADAAARAGEARAAVAAFIAAAARGDEAADTLLAPGADFIATGIVVTRPPRLAGMVGPGEGTIEEARTVLAGDLAWVAVVYRWVGRTPESVERARATFVLERRPAGWRIRHVHSSMVERWD